MNTEVTHKSPLKDIAKQVRADIKKAKADGRLQSATKVSVRTEHYSMGCSLNVSITGFAPIIHTDAWVWFVDDHPHDWHILDDLPEHRFTPEAINEKKVIDSIVRTYHADYGSDSQTDYYCVNFSFHGCSFSWELERDDKKASLEVRGRPIERLLEAKAQLAKAEGLERALCDR